VTVNHQGRLFLSGDVCIQKFRHNEYIDEKLAYTSPKTIAKRDRMYFTKHGSDKRFMEFVQVPVKRYDANERILYDVKGELYRLRNMDVYFFMNEERKQKQYHFLESNTL